MNADDRAVIDSPLGRIGLHAQSGVLVSVDFLPETADLRKPLSPFLRAVAAQFADYFHDGQKAFDLPLADAGTPYQRAVWKALTTIPPGEARTYGQLARQVGGSPRSVAGACRANPWPIVVPCHRLVAKNGLGGYCGTTQGKGLQNKCRLLEHEGWPGADAGE
jgi:methylated-DNA-[protein]-cysteine S-methyltransferase